MVYSKAMKRNRRNWRRIKGRGLFSNIFTNGYQLVKNSLKNIGNKALPVVTQLGKQALQDVYNNARKELPNAIGNATQNFINDAAKNPGNISNILKKHGNIASQGAQRYAKNEIDNLLKSNLIKQGKSDLKNIAINEGRQFVPSVAELINQQQKKSKQYGKGIKRIY